MNSITASNLPIRITYHWLVRILCLVSIFGFVWFTGLLWYLGQSVAALFFLVFFLFSIYRFITTFATTHIDKVYITVKPAMCLYRMAWDEITYIETNGSRGSRIGNTVVFRSNTKSIVVNLAFTGKQGNIVRSILEQEISGRNIPIRPLHTVSPKNINTRI